MRTAFLVPVICLVFNALPAQAGDALKKLEDQLSASGVVAGYVQGTAKARINKKDYSANNIAGVSAELGVSYAPMASGRASFKIKYTQNGTLHPDSQLLSSINEINTGPDNRGKFLFNKAYYTQDFMDGGFFIAAGKSDPETYLDGNAFANDQYTQFITQPLVDTPILDNEDEYGPFVALGGKSETMGWTLYAGSSSHSWPGARSPKDVWEDVFDGPFLGAQATWSPTFQGLSGNYRFYAWLADYDHARLSLDSPGYDSGWGVGLSLDQKVKNNIGLFFRAGYQNENVYEIPWLVSGGAAFTGIIPGRENDVLALGAAGLWANPDTPGHDTETHLEAYYRFVLHSHLALTTDIQYVLDPGGNSENNGLFAWMLRMDLTF